MSEDTRWVIVDDEDPNISWSGSWETTTERFNDPFLGDRGLNSFGPPMYGSQHVTNTTGSMSFTFEGSHIRVGGTSHLHRATGARDPQWSCIVDGQRYNTTPVIGPTNGFPLNKWEFCDVTGFPPSRNGSHIFTLEAHSDERPLYVDYIEYKPYLSVRESLFPAVRIQPSDPAVRYSEGWMEDPRVTREHGTKVRVDFNGTKATWVGWIAAQNSGPSSGSYSVDWESSTPFVIPASPGIDGPGLYFQTFFETPILPRGQHHIVVTFESSPADTPLTFDNIIIEDGDIFVTNASALFPSDPFAEPRARNLGAIIGGVVGAVVFIVIICFLVWWWRRRRKSTTTNNSRPPNRH